LKTTSQVTAERVERTVRNRFNPIRGLTPQLLVQQIDQWRTGYLRPMALTWDAMERRDLMLANVAGKRKKSVARLPWEIIVEDESPEAAKHQEVLKQFYKRLRCVNATEPNEQGGVRLLIKTMADAIGKRWSVHEIVWKPGRDGQLGATLRWCPLWFFEARTGPLRFLTEEYAMDGIELAAGEWMITSGDGIMEPTSVGYIFKSLPLKDALALCEKFGMPGLIANTSAPRGSEEWEALKAAVADYGQDFGIVTSQGEQITTVPASMAGQAPQLPLVEYWDKQIASLWRGADLSTISGQGGSPGTGASLQGEESQILTEDDAATFTETLNEQLDRQVIAYFFGPDTEPLAWFKLIPPKRQNTTVDLQVDEFLIKHRFPVSRSDVAERYGRAPADDDDELLTAPVAPVPGQQTSTLTAPASTDLPKEAKEQPAMENEETAPGAIDAVLAAMAQDLEPVRERMERILAIEDPEIFRARMQALVTELPGLARDIGQDPAAGETMGREMLAAFQTGAQARKERSKP
jgi:phage gp29-like protein